jgi:hypothetical protein
MPALSQPFGFLAPNRPIEQVLALLRRDLEPSDGPLLYIGPSNELSPQMVQLTWDIATDRHNGLVEVVKEVPPAMRPQEFDATLARLVPAQILLVTYDKGARIDTLDQRTVFRSQPSFARLMEGRIAGRIYSVRQSIDVDGNRMHIRILERTE